MSRSGVWSSSLLVVSLLITPLRIGCRNTRFGSKDRVRYFLHWIRLRRRYLGVASFGYALLHTIFYIRQIDEFESVIAASVQLENFTGWVAFILFLLLAITSNNYAVRKLGAHWQRLHRWVYLSAILVFMHWWLFDYRHRDIYYWFMPLLILQLHRVLVKLRD